MTQAENRITESALHRRFTHIVDRRRLDEAELRRHLPTTDPVLVLMSLIHVTGDIGLLDRFSGVLRKAEHGELLPGVTEVETIAGSSTMSDAAPEVWAELIDLAVANLSRDAADQPEYLNGYDLDPELFIRMASLAVDEPVHQENAAMFLEQTGFVRPLPSIEPVEPRPTERIEMAIIGAGMTGLAAAIQAMDRGFEFKIFESTEDIGGVWSLNDYPGVAVDTPAAYYSLSYEMNADWSNYYPVGQEYLDYLRHVVDKYDLEDRIELGSEVLRLRWVEADDEWALTVVRGGREAFEYRARTVMTCLGHLNRPVYPDLPGRDAFKGQSVHANRWDHDLDLAGKRVGVIGTGATGVQVIGAIAAEVDHLTVFQRQPMWIAPNRVGDGVVPEGKRWARNHLPYYQHWDRLKDYWSFSDRFGYPVVRADPEWAKDHLSISPANDAAMQYFLRYIHACFGEGTELADKLTPNYAPLGKRIVRDPYDFAPGGFYHSLTLPHVDLETAKLARVVPDGILTTEGKLIELDVIVYATGLTLDWLSPIEVIGRDGIRLSERWRDNNPASYLGGLVPGFPNLFVNSGPHTGAAHAGGHNFMAEVVNNYALECLQLLENERARSIEVTEEAHDDHNRAIDEGLAGSIWTWERRANTYYTNQKGRPILPTPWRHVDFWAMTRRPDPAAFHIR